MTTAMCCFEAARHVDVDSLGFTVVAAVTEINGWTRCLVEVVAPDKCWMVAGPTFGGLTPNVGWLHRADCPMSADYPTSRDCPRFRPRKEANDE